ncbi:unnamed protein product, partial [Nesidiocoris tenuis]
MFDAHGHVGYRRAHKYRMMKQTYSKFTGLFVCSLRRGSVIRTRRIHRLKYARRIPSSEKRRSVFT